MSIEHQLESAQRLGVLMQHVGFALWQLQELEHMAASFFVIRVKSTKGMGEAAGNELLNRALKQTLGTTLKELKNAGVIEESFSDALTAILHDRNWLIHKARRDNRGVVFNAQRTEELLIQVVGITNRCESLLKRLAKESTEFVDSQGIDRAKANRLALKLARSWELPI